MNSLKKLNWSKCSVGEGKPLNFHLMTHCCPKNVDNILPPGHIIMSHKMGKNILWNVGTKNYCLNENNIKF